MFSKFVFLVVSALAVISLTGADDSTTSSTPTLNDVQNMNLSGDGTQDWTTLRTTFNNSLLKDMPAQMMSSDPSRPRPGQINITGVKIPSGAVCENRVYVEAGALTYGYRVDPDNGACNSAVIALYDIKGQIVGIQARFAYSESKDISGNNYNYTFNGFFLTEIIGGKSFFVITAYFVDPSTICRSQGRDTQATGTGNILAFQRRTPADLLYAPNDRATATSQKWSQNNCFPGMGKHNFWNVSSWQANGCTQLVPAFLLYNYDTDKLIGFGFDFVGKAVNCRFEQPPVGAIKLIVGSEIPQCLVDKADTSKGGPGVTTMHVFFVHGDPSCNIGAQLAQAVKDAVTNLIKKFYSWF